jgi:hypothetical protein
MAPLNLELLDPERDGSLERYAAQIQELVLWIREEGHILSSMDQHFVEQWWEAGYPLETILASLRESGERLKGRKNPPRGLPLRSMKRWVVKEGERARDRSVGQHGQAEELSRDATLASGSASDASAPSSLLTALGEDISAAQASASPDRHPALSASLAEVQELADKDLGESEIFAELLAVGRRYYDRCWMALPAAERIERRAEISASLGESVQAMDPEALEATLEELSRRFLRIGDPLFDPQRYWSL